MGLSPSSVITGCSGLKHAPPGAGHCYSALCTSSMECRNMSRFLLRKAVIRRANRAWSLNTTYSPMARGFVYLTAVVDVSSRMVLAHKVAVTLEARGT